MARVDGTEPKTCEYCGETTEDFEYPLKHPRRCQRQVMDQLKEKDLQNRELANKLSETAKDAYAGLTDAIELRVKLDSANRLNGEMRELLQSIAMDIYTFQLKGPQGEEKALLSQIDMLLGNEVKRAAPVTKRGIMDAGGACGSIEPGAKHS